MSDAPTRESRPAKAVVAPLLATGQQLGGYQVVRLVGKGGMGEVYQARQLSMDREVALKVLSPRLAQKDPSFAKRFVEEARAAGKLNHANIIHVHDVSTATLPDGTEGHFFSMEFIDGESVQAILDREGRLPVPQLRTVMTGVAEALAFAAKVGIVHRDIKPDNIMITRSGLVKVADLGLAVPSQTGDDHAPERDEKGRAKVMGTPLYLSPEQARALPVDHRSDQYSLGATLFHFLTGDAPYRGPDAKSIMKAHVVDPVPDPADRIEDVDEAWRQLCMRLMAKKPEERFATAKELVEAVEAACEGVTIEQLERRKRGFHVPPHVRMWAFIALGAVVVILAFILLLRQGGGRPADPPADPPGQATVAPPIPAAPPAAGIPIDLAPFDKAVAERRLADAQRQLAGLDQKSPAVVAAAGRLAAARTEARKALGAKIAGAKADELDGILAAAGTALPDDDRPWLSGAIDARRAELAPAKPAAPSDEDRWRELLRQLDKARAGLAFDEVRSSIEKAAGGFAAAEAKAAVAGLAPLSPLAQSGEMALRAYIGAAQPHAVVVLGGKNVDVLLNRLSRTEVFYIVQKDGAPGSEQRVERSKVGMPWPQLLDDALKDQGVEHAPQVKAASLWMWALPEARAAFTAIKDAPLTKAVAELEKHRK